MPVVSIILPTYNVERYLQQCLSSIAQQTYVNIEVIIIIDGATDGSFDEAKKFCEKDTRFKVYWQENAGSGPARNNGIQHATGSLVLFIDPDDWIEPDYVENLVNIQRKKNFDLVVTKAISYVYRNDLKLLNVRKTNTRSRIFDTKEKCRQNYVDLLCEDLIAAPHCKLYKSELIKKNNIEFPDLRRSQDVVFNYRYYNVINNLYVSDYSGYNYRVVIKERMKRLKPDFYKTINYLFLEIESLHKQWGIYFDEVKCATDFYNPIYALLEANTARGESIKYILNDTNIRHILKLCKTYKISFKFNSHVNFKWTYYNCPSNNRDNNIYEKYMEIRI